MGSDQIALGPIGTVSAAVENKLDMFGDDEAVFLDPGFDLDHRAVARIAGDQFLGVIDQQFHRPPGPARQRVAKRDIVAVAFAAEIAADVARMNDQARGRNLQCTADHFAHAERTLVRRPDYPPCHRD